MKSYLILNVALVFVLSLFYWLIIRYRKNRPFSRPKHVDYLANYAGIALASVLGCLLFSSNMPPFRSDDALINILQIVFIISTVTILVFVIYRAINNNSNIDTDERTELSDTKTARNVLLATSIAFFVFLVGSDNLTLGRSDLIIILGCDYFTGLGSGLFYYFRKP
jgi:Ca2+/Na+ antiporter